MYPANSYVIRRATDADAPTLRHLADLDSSRRLSGAVLIAETGGLVVAAISLVDDRVIANPFERTAVAVQLLHLRVAALRAYSRAPSLTDRVRDAMHPFRAAHART
jgi:hypothetical protein